MLRIALTICLLCGPPLAAEADPLFALTSASISIKLVPSDKTVTAEVTCQLSVRNDGGAGELEFAIPSAQIPDSKDSDTGETSFSIKVNDEEKPSESDRGDQFSWTLNAAAGQELNLRWTYTGGTTFIPHTHPLGRRSVNVSLAYLRKFAALPEAVQVTITYDGLSPELFERQDAVPITISHPAGRRMEDFRFEWAAATLSDKQEELATQLESFSAKQRTADNRSYTTTLVKLAELYALAGQQQLAADTCGTLADLAAASGKPLMHCGPSAKWRLHVPWRLLQMQALAKLGKDVKEVAGQAKTAFEQCWSDYLEARKYARPFDHFDRTRWGSYWDYDWKRTRELYAQALEILGEEDAARAVREVED